MSIPQDTSAHRQSAVGGLGGLGVKPTWEKWAGVVLLVLIVAFGANVLKRSAYSDRRRTDAGVFFRAGWAVRNNISPYLVTDENDLFYIYPPGMAAFMFPLADPPASDPLPYEKDFREHPRPEGYLPYDVSIVIWYALSVLAMGYTVHATCRALEESSPNPAVRTITPARGGWWNLRFWGLLAVLPDVLSTLSKGQVSTFLLACIAGGSLMLVRGRKLLAGALWAAAGCAKVFPGVLGFEVLARLDRRMMIGMACCTVALMVVLPMAVYGPEKAVEHTVVFADRVLLAGALGKETTMQSGSEWSNTDNQCFAGVLHNVTNITTPRGERPKSPASWVQPTHAIASLLMIAVTLTVGRGWRVWSWKDDPGLIACLRAGMLCCVMIAAVPMCHRHYGIFLYPGITALVFISLRRSPYALPTGAALTLVIMLPIATGVAKIEQQGLVRDLPILLAAALAVWGVSLMKVRELATQSRL